MLHAIGKFGTLSQAISASEGRRLSAMHDSITRALANDPRGSGSFEIGHQIGNAAATFLASDSGRAAFESVLDAGVSIVRDLFGLPSAAAKAAASGGAAAAEAATTVAEAGAALLV